MLWMLAPFCLCLFDCTLSLRCVRLKLLGLFRRCPALRNPSCISGAVTAWQEPLHAV